MGERGFCALFGQVRRRRGVSGVHVEEGKNAGNVPVCKIEIDVEKCCREKDVVHRLSALITRCKFLVKFSEQDAEGGEEDGEDIGGGTGLLVSLSGAFWQHNHKSRIDCSARVGEKKCSSVVYQSCIRKIKNTRSFVEWEVCVNTVILMCC